MLDVNVGIQQLISKSQIMDVYKSKSIVQSKQLLNSCTLNVQNLRNRVLPETSIVGLSQINGAT